MQLKNAFAKLINDAKTQTTKQSPLTIINQHMGSPVKTNKKPINSNQPTDLNNTPLSIKSPIQSKLDLISPQKLPFLKYLYSQKFPNINKSTKSLQCLEQFVARVNNKNKYSQYLNLSDLYIDIREHKPLNIQLTQFTRINLSTLKLDLKKLQNLFHQNICQIVLKNCGLDNESMAYLFRRLKESNIFKLDLSSEEISNKNKLTHPFELYDLISTSSTLSILCLADVGLNSQNCVQLFQHIKQSNIQFLDLSKNNNLIGVSNQIQILKLKNNKIQTLKGLNFKQCRFQLLDMSNNKLQIRNMEPLFKTQVLIIKELVLDNNPLGSVDFLQKFLLEKGHIKKLSLKKCYLNDGAIKSIMNGVQNNINIQALNLSNNNISRDGCKPIIEVIRKSKLKSFHLAQCEILDQVGQSLIKELAYNKKLKYLNLSQNRLSQLTGQALLFTLRTNRTLLKIDTSENIIPYKFTKYISQWVQYNNYLIKQRQQPIITTTTQPEGSEDDQTTLNTLCIKRSSLQKDVQKLTAENSKLTANKQVFQELQQVFKWIDDQGTDSINNLLDQLDIIKQQINQQKTLKIQIGRKSLQPS